MKGVLPFELARRARILGALLGLLVLLHPTPLIEDHLKSPSIDTNVRSSDRTLVCITCGQGGETFVGDVLSSGVLITGVSVLTECAGMELRAQFSSGEEFTLGVTAVLPAEGIAVLFVPADVAQGELDPREDPSWFSCLFGG
ncbi:MAG: hypothetical protein AB2A00_01680 [Myxococcota bacterium]